MRGCLGRVGADGSAYMLPDVDAKQRYDGALCDERILVGGRRQKELVLGGIVPEPAPPGALHAGGHGAQLREREREQSVSMEAPMEAGVTERG